MMYRYIFRTVFSTLFFPVWLLGVSTHAAATAPATKPNIIFILTDDLGYGDIGVFYQNQRKADGKPAELTPNLDAMAAQGIQLRDHYTSAPVCAPARGTLLAGVDQGHAGVRDNQFDKALEDNHTLATVLKAAGYTTAVIGKWGLQGAKEIPESEESGTTGADDGPALWPAYPTKRGFDYFFGYVRHRDGHEHYPFEGKYDGHKQVWDMDHEISAQLAGCYTADLWTARAKKWITDQHTAAPDKPFFLYLAYDTPHAVLEYPAAPYPEGGGLKGGMQWLGKPGNMISTASGTPDSFCYPEYANATFDEPFGKMQPAAFAKGPLPWPEMNKRYATDVRRLDDCVGDVLQLLRDLHIDDNTIVVFTSDNGPSTESYIPKVGPSGKKAEAPEHPNFFHSFGPFDGIKRDCWEGGIREGAIVRWPGKIPAGQVSETPSQFQDWMPTLAELAGIAAPARTDGVSLVPTLTGQPGQTASTIYSEYFFKGNTPGFPEFAPAHRNRERGQMQLIRFGDFVGVRYNIQSQADLFEIYDITRDPQETKDLTAGKPELEQQMHDAVLQDRRPDPTAPRPYDNELVPANMPTETKPGVTVQTVTGSFRWLPKIDLLPGKSTGTAATIADSFMVPMNSAKSPFAFLETGFINAPADGTYTFSLDAKGKALFRLHDATVIDEDFGYTGGTRTGEIKLKAGLHAFRLYYLPGGADGPHLDLQWSINGAPSVPIPTDAFSH